MSGYAQTRATLTPRMRDVLTAAASGLTTRQTAQTLHLSEATVWTVRAALCARLGASNITAAVYVAARRGELR